MGVADELRQAVAGLFPAQAVQINLTLHAPATAPQFAQHIGPHAGSAKTQCVVCVQQGADVELVRNGFAHNGHFIELVLYRYRGGWLGAQAGPLSWRVALRQGLDRADGTFEKLFFGLALAGCGQAFGFLLRRQLGLRLKVLLEGLEAAQVFDSGLAG